MKKIKIYNHQFLNDDYSWVYIYLDQLKQLEDFGLLAVADSIDVTALGTKPHIELLKDLSKTYVNITIHEISTNISEEEVVNVYANNSSGFVTETPTIYRIWKDSQNDDFNALYFHGKGASAFPRSFKTGDTLTFKNYYYWRKFLEWGVLEKWKDCVNALDIGNQVAGCNYNYDPFPHFSGNFWWARSDYIRTLDDISNSTWWKTIKQPCMVDRLVDEMWPCHKATNIFNLNSPPPELCSPNPGLYSQSYLRKNYEFI